MCPEPQREELHLKGWWRSRLEARLAEDWAPCAHSRLASIPTFQLPFLWIQEHPPAPLPLHLGKIWKERFLPFSSGWDDGAQGGGLRDKQKEQLTVSLQLLGLCALGAPSNLLGAWSPVLEPPLWGSFSVLAPCQNLLGDLKDALRVTPRGVTGVPQTRPGQSLL